MNSPLDVVIIGGGQAGLALGYYLRRTALSWSILDNQSSPGGAWTRTWDSLRLFSPARWSSLPGRLMPGGEDEYPSRDDALRYFEWYEANYGLGVRRPVDVYTVAKAGEEWAVHTSTGEVRARAVVSATGTWSNPVVPDIPGASSFVGVQLHSAHYRSPEPFANQRVAIVGAGNSAAQILAELSEVAGTLWCTLEPPRYLPDDVDGRYLFEQATIRYRAQQQGLPAPPPASLGDIVMVDSVRRARERGAMNPIPMFSRLTPRGAVWADGKEEQLDAVVYATGFRAALAHLAALDLVDDLGRIETEGTRCVAEPTLWLVGYGSWTGFASATVVGVGRSARQTVSEITDALGGE